MVNPLMGKSGTTAMTAKMGQAHRLAPAEEIPLGEGRVFYVEGTPVAVFRTRQGDVFATQAACPHKRGPLADGIIAGGQIVCPLHAYKFDLATGKPTGNDCVALQTYAAALDDNGDILLSLSCEG